MAIAGTISGGERFIILDPSDLAKQNFDMQNIANIQIIDPVNKNSYQDIEAIKNRIGNSLKSEEKRKGLFTITLNVDEKYKNESFR